jgi:hypothetical protein
MSRPGFLLAEDEALKEHLKGMSVSDDRNNARPVKVFFRYPETETEKEFPFITIEMVSMNYARYRQHSEHFLYYGTSESGASISSSHPNYIGYYPSELDQDDLDELLEQNGDAYLKTQSYVQVDLVYQIATHTRNALHDRQLTSMMLRNKLTLRSNFLVVPADGTVRRLDLLSWSQSDLLDAEAGYRKRIFRKVYTVQINAELPVTELEGYKRVDSIIGTITSKEDDSTRPPSPFLLLEDF